MNTNLERCPQHAWHLEQDIQDENHRIEALWIALRGWWNHQRTELRLTQIKQILSELNYEKYGHNRK